MPAAISALEAAIDDAAGTRRWVDGDGSTLSDLDGLGWDIHAKAAGETLAIAAAAAPENLVLGLISRGAPLWTLTPATEWRGNGRSALINACAARRRTVVDALVAAGALAATPADPDLERCRAELERTAPTIAPR